MNYPYIIQGDYKFSLIEPYTIDDKIITKFEVYIDYAPMWEQSCSYYRFTLETDEVIRVNIPTEFRPGSLSYQYWEGYIRSLYDQRYSNEYVQRECHAMQMNWQRTSSFIKLIDEEIREQCDSFERNNYSRMYSVLVTELYRQGREHARVFNTSIPEFPSSWANVFFDTPPRRDIRTITYVASEPEPTIINAFNYIPFYKKHYMPDESESSLLLGAEIEVDCGGKDKNNARGVLEIMNGKEVWDSEENIYCVSDGSLSNGLEFPTQPGTLAWHKSLPYEKMFEYLDSKGYKAHDTNTCGLHVHINRSFFGEAESDCIAKIIYILEKFSYEFSAIGRRNCSYAKLMGYNGEKCKELLNKMPTNSKYNAVNLLHSDTIEFRSFKGTLKYSTFIHTLEFVSNLAHFVKNNSIEVIENMKWSDLYDTFSEELKAYYDERNKIEQDRVAKESETAFDPSRRRAYQYLSTPRSSGSLWASSNSATSEWAIRNASVISGTIIFENGTSINLAPASTVSISTAESTNTAEQTDEQKLKALQRELKNARHYVQKKNIRKEIQQLQKTIKARKKSERRNNNRN